MPRKNTILRIDTQGYVIRCVMFLFSLWGYTYAQFGEGVDLRAIKSMFISQSDSMGKKHIDFPFENIGKVDYYYDKKAYKEITDSESNPSLQTKLMLNYLTKFGIQNFKKDIGMVWKIARNLQMAGDTARALSLYELAVKHSRGARNSKQPAMDSLYMPTKSEWLPMEDYYKLLEYRRRIDTLIPPKNVLLNMGKLINSTSADYAPFMHPSDSLLMFTSRRGSELLIDDIFGKQNEDIYYVLRDFRTGKWKRAEKLGPEINTGLLEGSACLSPNGRMLYFTRCGDPVMGMGDCDLYQAEWLPGDKWTNIENMGAGINTTGWDSHPSITPDGTILFFASDRPGGFGGLDIYYSLRQPDGSWAPAQNLGPIINTPENEITPFYHTINQTLYFGSTGQLKTFGGYDIYRARWLGLQWEEPRNLGPLVNTPGNEYYFTIDSKGETIFYAKSDAGDNPEDDKQNFDLYSFPMPMEARPDAIHKVTGFLLDSITGKPLKGIVMVVDLDKNVEIAPKRINDNGYFEFTLRPDAHYRIYILGPNYLTIRKDYPIHKDTLFNFFAESFQTGDPIVFESLEFEENSFKINYAMKPKLDYLCRFLIRYPQFNITVRGHTDSDGDENYNLKLSEKRAVQIQEYMLKESGLKPSRVTAEGVGEAEPVVPNDSPANKKKNRRVEFVITQDKNYLGPPAFMPTKEELEFDEYVEDVPLDAPLEEQEDFLKEFEDEDMGDEDIFDEDPIDDKPEEKKPEEKKTDTPEDDTPD